MKNIISLSLLLFVFSCARAPIKERSEAMRKTSRAPALSDDLSFESLKVGLRTNLDYIKNSSRVPNEMMFGSVRINKNDYIKSLRRLLDDSQNHNEFQKNIVSHFDFYEVYGLDSWGEIKVTSYYSPLLKASKKPTKVYSQALLETPDDMLTLDIDAFADDFPKWRTFKDSVLEQKSSRSIARARLIEGKDGGGRIVPYYKREDIDSKKRVDIKKHALAYVDPVDAFFLQIQGSGIVEFKNGEKITLGYDSQNGHPYVAIGSKLLDRIPKEKMSMQSIRNYLKTLSKTEQQEILNLNPSYVFFKKIDTRPVAYLGTEVVDGRTVATDQSLFPKGALAFLEFEKPQFQNLNDEEPSSWQPAARFVIDQDTGGAIRGPGRLDLYAGEGDEAAQFAGVMKNPGRLYYLVPKPEYLKDLK